MRIHFFAKGVRQKPSLPEESAKQERKQDCFEVLVPTFFTCGRAALRFRCKLHRPEHSVIGRGSVVKKM